MRPVTLLDASNFWLRLVSDASERRQTCQDGVCFLVPRLHLDRYRFCLIERITQKMGKKLKEKNHYCQKMATETKNDITCAYYCIIDYYYRMHRTRIIFTLLMSHSFCIFG
jgi:hypothetical protein